MNHDIKVLVKHDITAINLKTQSNHYLTAVPYYCDIVIPDTFNVGHGNVSKGVKACKLLPLMWLLANKAA